MNLSHLYQKVGPTILRPFPELRLRRRPVEYEVTMSAFAGSVLCRSNCMPAKLTKDWAGVSSALMIPRRRNVRALRRSGPNLDSVGAGPSTRITLRGRHSFSEDDYPRPEGDERVSEK